MSDPTVNLHDLGWTTAREEQFTPLHRHGLVPGRVATEDKSSFRIVTATGEITGSIPGRFRHTSLPDPLGLPKVGDWVALRPIPGESKAIIEKILPRTSHLTRKVAGRETTEQVLAANIEISFLVQPLDTRFNPRLLERHLLMAASGGSRPVILLNKADLCQNLDARIAEAQASAGNQTILVVSARTRKGMGELRRLIPNATTAVFLGASGVGKSSLVNRLMGDQVMDTLPVRETDSKGRHTTTWRELLLLPGGGLVIDTPGIREFHVWTAEDGLAGAFPDIEEWSLQCHFRGCQHAGETRCAVQLAIQNSQLSPDRLKAWRKLADELKGVEDRRWRSQRNAGGRRRKPLSDEPSLED